MKKLLFLLVAFLGFLGVSSAATYSTTSINPSTKLSDTNWYGVPVYCFLSGCHLDSVTLATNTDCHSWALFDYNLNLQASGVATGQIIYVDYLLNSNKKYFFAIGSGSFNSQATCNHYKFSINSPNYDLLSASSPSSVYGLLGFAFDLDSGTPPSLSVNSSVFSYYYDFRYFTFSGSPDFVPEYTLFTPDLDYSFSGDIYIFNTGGYSVVSSGAGYKVTALVSGNTSVSNTIYNNGLLLGFTGSTFYISGVDNVATSGDMLLIYNGIGLNSPQGRSGLILQESGVALLATGNVMGQLPFNVTKLLVSQLPSIFLALGALFVIWLVLKIFVPRRKKFHY